VAEDVVMHMPRLLVFAVIAFTLAAAAASAPAGPTADAAGTCGLAIQIQDPGLRAAFERFERNQSPAAAKVCASYRNEMTAALAAR
jgi:hypothetical protein